MATEQVPLEVSNLFEKLGLDIKKPAEVYVNYSEKDVLCYGGFYIKIKVYNYINLCIYNAAFLKLKQDFYIKVNEKGCGSFLFFIKLFIFYTLGDKCYFYFINFKKVKN